MSTTSLFEAKQPDPQADARGRKRLRYGIILLIIVLILGAVAYMNRYWPEERVVDKFFTAVEKKDFETAYAIWRADPQWQQHTDKYKEYPFGQFQLDWGPTGEYGYITKHDIRGSIAPSSNNTETSGVIVAVRLNGIVDTNKTVCLWVEKSTKTINFSPRDCRAQ
jgi:hypothetical protein